MFAFPVQLAQDLCGEPRSSFKRWKSWWSLAYLALRFLAVGMESTQAVGVSPTMCTEP